MSQYFPEPYERSRGMVELDISENTRKTDPKEQELLIHLR